METARRTTLATLLLALAIVAFATAVVNILNITEWVVMAKSPPVVKVAGSDVGNGPGSYVNVTWYTASDGTNRTSISVVGFRGDWTNYTSVLRICNKDPDHAVRVTLVYKGGNGTGSWSHVKYIVLRYPGDSSSPQQLTITDSTSLGTTFDLGRISGGQCSESIGVGVLVDANTPDQELNTRLIAIEIDVVAKYNLP